MLVNATGVVPVARVEIISTSCKSITRRLSFSFVCAQTFSAAINRHAAIAYFLICNLNY
ncbi:unknown [Bacteroides clarus CAG:160]|nr:unknown [Bacteroides clarus CAG:160]